MVARVKEIGGVLYTAVQAIGLLDRKQAQIKLGSSVMYVHAPQLKTWKLQADSRRILQHEPDLEQWNTTQFTFRLQHFN